MFSWLWLLIAKFLEVMGNFLAMYSGCVLDVWLNEPEMPECLKAKRKGR